VITRQIEMRKIAYVHDSPDHAPIETRWKVPRFLASRGFTDMVIADQFTGAQNLLLENADEGIARVTLSQLDERIHDCLNAGLRPWVMQDLFTLSADFPHPSEGTRGCACSSEVWDAYTENTLALLARFPDLEGLIFRFGESFTSPHTWAIAHNPLACTCARCEEAGSVGIVQKFVENLGTIVCDFGDRHCILRLWDLGDDGIHANFGRQADALSTWNNDERFMVSVKHTQTDYWRHQPWNSTIDMLGPPRLVELQCEREYEFVGMVPNWLGELWANGPGECGERGETGMANLRPPHWAGLIILPRGGGWARPLASDELWAEMNVHAAVALGDDPTRDPNDILEEWMQSVGFASESSGVTADLALLLEASSDLVLNLRYLRTYQALTEQLWMPSENWFRDDTFVPGACAIIANAVTEAGVADDLRQERALTTALAERHLDGAELAFTEGQPLGEHPKAAFVLDSYRFAHRFAEWTEALWNELLAAAPLDRDAARAMIEARLAADPLPPLRVLD